MDLALWLQQLPWSLDFPPQCWTIPFSAPTGSFPAQHSQGADTHPRTALGPHLPPQRPSAHTLAGEPGARTLGLWFCFTPGLLEVGTCLCLYEVAQRLLFNPFYGNSQTLPSGSSSQEMPDLRFRLSSSCLLCLTFATVGWTGNGSMSREQGLGASFGAYVHPPLSLLSSRQTVPGCLLRLSFPFSLLCRLVCAHLFLLLLRSLFIEQEPGV